MTVSSDGVIVLADVRTGTRKTVRTESSLLGVVAVGQLPCGGARARVSLCPLRRVCVATSLG